MIASLEGPVAAVGADHVIVTVGGIGFRVRVPDTLLQQLSSGGAHVRLDHLQFW